VPDGGFYRHTAIARHPPNVTPTQGQDDIERVAGTVLIHPNRHSIPNRPPHPPRVIPAHAGTQFDDAAKDTGFRLKAGMTPSE